MKSISFSFLLIFVLYSCTYNNAGKTYNRLEGYVFGTSYHIIYDGDSILEDAITSALNEVNVSLSTYDSSSIISRINQNDPFVVPDIHFLTVFNKGIEVSEKTEGAFDMTVAPLVNVWGFGFSKKESVNKSMVDSILEFTGYHKVSLANGKIIKSDIRLMLDASAIAKGYGVDVVGATLSAHGCKNFMVEIGGEVLAKGFNEKSNPWAIAIDKPIDDPLIENRQFQEIIGISNLAIASSGNYRNFYYENGVKYAHTINPKTGYPAQTEVLSVSVAAPNCMTADAYATAFMVLGLEESLKLASQNPDLEAYFIYSGVGGEMNTKSTKGFVKLIKK